MRFWLGTHEPSWLGRLDVPLFVSHRRLARRVSLPQARSGTGSRLVGVAIVGRPVVWVWDDGPTAEVARVTNDGTSNTCSMLYMERAP